MDIEHSDQDTHAWICSAFEDRFELISHNDSSMWSKASFDSVLHDVCCGLGEDLLDTQQR